MLRIDANDKGKKTLEEESELESSDSDDDAKTQYERIGRNAARILQQQGKLKTFMTGVNTLCFPRIVDDRS